jgi:gas vesicle protein
MADEPTDGNWFSVGAILGGAVGLALGLILAPRPGAETRRALAERSAAWRSPDAGAASAATDSAPTPAVDAADA